MKRILVALDGSDRAGHVLAAAARLAVLGDAKLVLFRAIGVMSELPPDLLALIDARLEDVLERNAREQLDRLASTLPPGLVAQIAIDRATPWDGIVRAGRTHDADMIVIGSHGYGALDRLLGTTAAKVVNHADRDVLVVRALL
jgi:universal stress protein F